MRDMKECPVESAYLFTTQCSIRSCKYHSEAVQDHCLLRAGYVKDDKVLTDVELLKYKFPDTNLSEKEVGALRKKAVDRVKNVIMLYKCLTFIKENCNKVESFTYSETGLIAELLSRKPLSISRLSFEPWMFVYLLDPAIVSLVCGPKFSVQAALFLKQREYQTLVSEVKIAGEYHACKEKLSSTDGSRSGSRCEHVFVRAQ